MRIIDLSHNFTDNMPVFPGDTKPTLERHDDTESQIVHYAVTTSMHVGTHMDAPLHMIKDGKKLSDFPADKFIAKGHLIDARNKTTIDVGLLAEHSIAPGDCVLFYTGFDKKFLSEDFYTSYPDITEECAKKLVSLQVSFIGLDSPSPDKAPYTIHRILLAQDILIIESMNNLGALVDVSGFEVIALPTKFEAEAAPVRAIARIHA